MLLHQLSQPWRSIVPIFLLAIGIAALLQFGVVLNSYLPDRNSFDLPPSSNGGHSLASLALAKVLQDASPIFGLSAEASSHSATATWMKDYSDDTLLVHMNIPGTHDAATWNYTRETRDSLRYASDLAKISPVNPANYRCQSKSMAAMLEAGIRAFDLRYAYDITRTTLVFWHGDALQSETATVEDVLYAFYTWLDAHPSEALFLSFQHEGGGDDIGTQLALYNTLTSPAAHRYFVQTRGTLGDLGSARGKITLFRRFDLNLLPQSYEDSLPGLHFSPTKWTVNGANIELIYNETTSEKAYIQDYFHPQTPNPSPADLNIQYKFHTARSHFERAASAEFQDDLFWSFASSTNTDNEPPDTPRIMALGNGTLTPKGGVNQQLVGFFKGMRGKRLGITLFDFFEEPDGLIPFYLSLLGPKEARKGRR